MRMWGHWKVHTLSVEMQNGRATLENSLAAFYKASIHLPYEAEVPLLGIKCRERQAYVHTETST